MIKIRKMNINDYDTVYALWLSCAGMGLNNLDDSGDGIDKFIKRNPDTCFVAETENELVGAIMVGNDGRHGYIYHTAVNTEYRKQGMASKLVDAALQALKQCGINKAALVVFDRNGNGNLFWERQGFNVRNDLVYRDKNIVEITRIDT